MKPNLMFRLTGVVADLDEITPDGPGHPAVSLILECGDDLTRVVIPASVWPPERRELLAVDRPVAVAGESDGDPFRRGPEPWPRRYGSWTATTEQPQRTLPTARIQTATKGHANGGRQLV